MDSGSIRLIAESGLFRLSWYESQAGRTFRLQDAIQHYLDIGAAEGLDPNPYFDTIWYLTRYPDVIDAGLNPLVHYLSSGEKQGRAASPSFDPAWYRTFYPDIAAAGVSPLAHYLQNEASTERHPNVAGMLAAHQYFQKDFYCSQLGEDLSELEAAQHYLDFGAALGIDPNPYFDTRGYLESYPDVADHGINPLLHYIRSGEAEGRVPSEDFDPKWYARRYPDVTGSPLAHFLKYGIDEKRYPNAFAEDPDKKRRMSAVDGVMLPSDRATQLSMEFEVIPVGAAAKANKWRMIATKWKRAAIEHGHDDVFYPAAPLVVETGKVGLIGGSRYLASTDGKLVDDELSHFTSSDVAIKRHHVIRNGARVKMPITRRYGTRISRGVQLMHEYDTNYFHFVTEVLPRAIVATETVDLDADIPFLVTEGLHKNFRNLLSSVVAERELQELESGTMYLADKLWYTTDVSTIQDIYGRKRLIGESEIHVPLMRLIQERYLKANGIKPGTGPGRKIYIHRGSRVRGARNEPEVCEAMIARGFEVLTLDNLSMKSQANLFAEASIVVGPTGAGITNILWCRSGTPVIVIASEHPAMPGEIWSQLGMASGCNVQITSEKRAFNRDGLYGLHDDFHVDIPALLKRIDAVQ